MYISSFLLGCKKVCLGEIIYLGYLIAKPTRRGAIDRARGMGIWGNTTPTPRARSIAPLHSLTVFVLWPTIDQQKEYMGDEGA